MKRPMTLLCALVLAAFGLAACGSSDSGSSSSTSAATTSTSGEASGSTFDIAADSSAIAYDTTSASVKAGKVTVNFDNPASLAHDVVIEDADGNPVAQTDTISDSSTSTTAQLEPGKYAFFCSVDSHREQGMEGTLTVTQ